MRALNQCRPRTQSPGSKGLHNVPSWLSPLHEARATGQIPARRWILLSLGPELAHKFPWIAIPTSYRPSVNDNLSALAGLDCDIVIDDSTRYTTVRDLARQILNARPRRLLVQAAGDSQAIILLKRGVDGN